MLALAVAIAFALEVAIGEPPTRLHPVAWFGALVAPLDRDWTRPQLVGTLGAVALPLGAAILVAGLVSGAALVHPAFAPVSAGLALFLTTSLRALLVAAREVVAQSAADVEAARASLLALAGRDAETLSPGLLRSAAVESAAENLADGLVATLGAFALAGCVAGFVAGPALALAAGAATWVKAVNTMDSMLGYPDKQVGTPAARLDDAVMWLPARVSALLLAGALRKPRALGHARRWLDGVPSPNSGWPMGVAAAALPAKLTKTGVYTLNADAALPSVATAERGIRGVAIAGVIAYGLAGVTAWC